MPFELVAIPNGHIGSQSTTWEVRDEADERMRDFPEEEPLILEARQKVVGRRDTLYTYHYIIKE